MFLLGVAGYSYTPHCRIGDDYLDLDQPCSMDCTNQKLSAAIGGDKPVMTCSNKMLNYRLCSANVTALREVFNESQYDKCQVCMLLQRYVIRYNCQWIMWSKFATFTFFKVMVVEDLLTFTIVYHLDKCNKLLSRTQRAKRKT